MRSSCFVITLALLLCACSSSSHRSQGLLRDSVLSEKQQAATTPEQALQRLKEGNQRFLSSQLTATDYLAQARASSTGQYPIAFVLGCVDSRVPPEAVFDCSIGDLFVGRVAGNFENTDLLGSMEFAVIASGTPLIVVLGHTSCGAVKGACDGVELGNLTSLLGELRPALDQTAEGGDRTSANKEFVDRVARQNVRQTVKDILDRSPDIAAQVEAGDAAVVGALYHLPTGSVEWIDAE